MKRDKKLLFGTFALLAAVGLTACGGSKEGDKATSSTPATGGTTAEGEQPAALEKFADADTIVFNGTGLSGNFLSGFTNNAYDVYVKTLLGNYGDATSYSTYVPDEGGTYVLNKTVVKGEPKITENADGSKTYEFELNDGLKWSDGEKVTAKDYVFAPLFTTSPEWAELGANNVSSTEILKGYKEYKDGKTRTFSGLRLLGENKFSLTISKEWLPYYWETAYASMGPYPLHRFAPNMDVTDEGKGATLVVKSGYTVSDKDKEGLVKLQESVVADLTKEKDAADKDLEEAKSKGANEKELKELQGDADKAAKKLEAGQAKLTGLKDGSVALSPDKLLMSQSTLDVKQNYMLKPDVTCGPYKFVSFDNKICKLTVNENYSGDFRGHKPQIKNIVLEPINPKFVIDYIATGQLDFSPMEAIGATIDKGRKAADEGKVKFNEYARNGYGVINFITDLGATKYAGVRQAIAYSLDRDQFVQQIVGGYGVVIDAPYGEAMWETHPEEWKKVEKETGKTFKETFDVSALTHYTLNPDAANKALDESSPYQFEADGKTKWDANKALEKYKANPEAFDYWRYDKDGNMLAVYQDAPEESPEVTGLIRTQLPDNAKKVGMKYVVNAVDFPTLLTHYYTPKTDSATAPTAFSMGTGFGNPNDPYLEYHSSQIEAGNNIQHVNSPELDKILVTLRSTKVGDKFDYLNAYWQYIKWMNQNIISVPLYGNEYHDFYSPRVQGVKTNAMFNVFQQICDISLSK